MTATRRLGVVTASWVCQAALLATLLMANCAGASETAPVAPFAVTDDAITLPLAGRLGDALRGRHLVLDRERGNCLICHQLRVERQPFQGDLAPPLDGVGARLTPAQIRLRLVDQSRLNPATLMPPYHRVDALTRVAGRFKDRPVFDAQEIEDVVAWLATLKE